MEPDFKGKTVFVSGPYSSSNEQIKDIRFTISSIVCGVIMNKGGFPLSPVVHGVPIVRVMNVPDDFEYWKDYCIALVSKSDIVIVLMIEGWEESSGVIGEIEAAHELGKPVYGFGVEFDKKIKFIRKFEKSC